MFHVAVLLPFLFAIITSTNSIDLCNSENSTGNLTSYHYKNEPVQNCNCRDKTSCIRKCCAVGFYATKGVCLKQEDPDFVFEIPVYNEKDFVRNVNLDTEILAGVMSCDFFILPPNSSRTDWFFLQENGKLYTSLYGVLNNDNYCVDYVKGRGWIAFVCYGISSSRQVNAAGMIISMPFLLATFIAYALLPDRNLHMKALMFYVINLLLAYLFLVIIQLSDTRFGNFMCSFLAYACIFFFLVSFFWMNVICIDIWFGFSGLRGFSGSKKAAENKRFLLYFAYAWGMPIVLVSIIAIIDAAVKSNTSIWKPSIGDGLCFLKKGYPELIYFYGPLALLVTVNIVLFAITACRIRNIKKETSMLKKGDSKRHSYENEKQAFNLYLKLLFAMGVNWSMEIISWAVLWGQGSDNANAAVWYLTDFCNATYGVFIFFIFVFKRSIWKLLKKRYYSFIGKPHLAHSLTMNNTTRVTSCSTANSSVHENPHGVNDTSTLTTEA